MDDIIVYDRFNDIPQNMFIDDMSKTFRDSFFNELSEIRKYYEIYEKGANFSTSGSNGDYVPSNKRYKKIRKLINEEARFMFSQPLDIIVNKNENNTDEEKKNNSIVNDFIQNVLRKNSFNSKIIKAAKDCFIGKRICIVLNFDPTTGIKIDFLNALEFYYEFNGNELEKLIAFFVEVQSSNMNEKRIVKKSFELINENCYIVESLYDGGGNLLEQGNVIKTDLDFIPAIIVLNDGLTNDIKGESDVKTLIEDEPYYSKLANADIDSLLKSMNPIKYTIDATSESTENLSSSAGSYWDIQSDENGVEKKTASVGMLESNMSYSNALGATLERIDNDMHSQLSIPNIDSEKMQGMITSGKTLKALYFPLQVRSDEKCLVWYDAINNLINMLYDGALMFKESTLEYTVEDIPEINLKVYIEANYALPEDEQEEKAIDLQEVSNQTMSKKAYMKKWRGLTDEEADEELKQIALERQLLEDSFSSGNLESGNEEEEF